MSSELFWAQAVRRRPHTRLRLLWGVRPKLGLVGSKCFPAGLLAADASHVSASASALSALRSAVDWAVWPRKILLAST